MSARLLHLCFCNFCKGNTQLTRHKRKQHAEIYGLCNAEKTSTVKLTSAQKKSRVSLEDSSSEESDDGQALGVNTGKLPGEDHDDCPTGYESDIAMEQSPDVHSSSTTLEVLLNDS